MAIATLSPVRRAAAIVSRLGMKEYLQKCGGRDILRFDTQAEATECARTLRDRHPDITVAASYDRVEIKL